MWVRPPPEPLHLLAVMNKKELTEKLIIRLREKKAGLLESRNNYRKTSNEAMGATQSRSDTTKFQTGKLAENIENQLEKIERIILDIEELGDKKFDAVQIGSLIKLEGAGKISYLLIVPNGAGGETIKDKNTVVQTVAAESPLGKTLTLKKVGDNIKFEAPAGTKEIKILSIK